MGRIASNYYIDCETMSYFMSNLKPEIRESTLLYHMANASEFKQLEPRKEEIEELRNMCANTRIVDVDKNEITDSFSKVLLLFE